MTSFFEAKRRTKKKKKGKGNEKEQEQEKETEKGQGEGGNLCARCKHPYKKGEVCRIPHPGDWHSQYSDCSSGLAASVSPTKHIPLLNESVK